MVKCVNSINSLMQVRKGQPSISVFTSSGNSGIKGASYSGQILQALAIILLWASNLHFWYVHRAMIRNFSIYTQSCLQLRFNLKKILNNWRFSKMDTKWRYDEELLPMFPLVDTFSSFPFVAYFLYACSESPKSWYVCTIRPPAIVLALRSHYLFALLATVSWALILITVVVSYASGSDLKDPIFVDYDFWDNCMIHDKSDQYCIVSNTNWLDF